MKTAMTTIQPKKTVLIIESNGNTRRTLLEMLARKGCFILNAVDLAHAHRMILSPVDIVILDGEFPGVDVAKLQTQLMSANPEARLLINTAEPAQFDHLEGVEVFEKPREEKALEAALRECN
jgi:DNA-binding response OmpR family regulator